MRALSHLVIVSAAITVLRGSLLTAQVVETPVAFDSAGRVLALSPRLIERLGLTSPAWPIGGPFREARLFSINQGASFVLSVETLTGAFERFPLTFEERNALRRAIDAAMQHAGRPTGEIGSSILSESAGFSFAWHQGVLGLVVYGPYAAATFAGDYASAAYLAVAGTAFFVANGILQSTPISQAQDQLAYQLGFGGAGAAEAVIYLAGVDRGPSTYMLALASAVGGAVYGGIAGKTLSDAEAHTASGGMFAGAALAAGLAATGGQTGRVVVASALAGEIAGYNLGLAYPRTVTYTVTAGDATAVGLGGILGVGAGIVAASVVNESSLNTPAAWGLMTITYAAGLAIGDAALARPYDFTQSQAHYLELGAFAGGLLGGVFPLLTRTDNAAFATGMIESGALIGAMFTLNAINPARAGDPRLKVGSRRSARADDRLEFTPLTLAGVVARRPGRYALLTYRF